MIKFKLTDVYPQLPIHSDFFYERMLPDGTPWTQFHRIQNGYLLRFSELADFEVRFDGSEIRCRPALDVSESSVQQLYLNHVLPLALSRQGKLVFHASCVEIDGSAVCFVAKSGRGKSTLAASFATGSFPFLTDDSLLLEWDGSGFQAIPSHPSIRLWPDSQQALIIKHARAAPPVQYTDKNRFLAGDGMAHCDKPLRLRCVYFLGDSPQPAPKFKHIKAADALIELVRHSFLLDIEEQEMLATHFDELAHLVNLVRFYHLNYPRRFEELASIRQSIVEHVLNSV